jgi:hypothetical protein
LTLPGFEPGVWSFHEVASGAATWPDVAFLEAEIAHFIPSRHLSDRRVVQRRVHGREQAGARRAPGEVVPFPIPRGVFRSDELA